MNPSKSDFVFEPFDLPVFDVPQKEHGTMSWETVMRETEAARKEYLRHFDSPEKRLRNKNPEPFVMR